MNHVHVTIEKVYKTHTPEKLQKYVDRIEKNIFVRLVRKLFFKR